MHRLFLPILVIIAALNLNGCASLPGREPVQVTVADIESLPGEGLEVRMMVKLRVQNPNDAPVEYDGVYVKLDVLNRTFATGVSDERGSIPRFGESVIAPGVPVASETPTFEVGASADGAMTSGACSRQHQPKRPPTGKHIESTTVRSTTRRASRVSPPNEALTIPGSPRRV